MNDFGNTIQLIGEARAIQEGKITGVAADKQKEEEEMIGLTIQVAGRCMLTPALGKTML